MQERAEQEASTAALEALALVKVEGIKPSSGNKRRKGGASDQGYFDVQQKSESSPEQKALAAAACLQRISRPLMRFCRAQAYGPALTRLHRLRRS